MSIQVNGLCWHCSRPLTAADYGRESACPACSKPTRVCRNCRHYAPGRPNDCVEPMVERVLDKERANFCELFDATDRPGAPKDTGSSAEDLIKAANAIFK